MKKSIETVKIGNQVWQKNNLNVLNFSNGDEIPLLKTVIKMKNAGIKKLPACTFTKNETTPQNGVLYNWYALNDKRGLAPEGFRIPTVEDWIELLKFIGSEEIANEEDNAEYPYVYKGSAKKLKSKKGWENAELGNGSDDFGFSLKPYGAIDEFGYDSYPETTSKYWTISEVNKEVRVIEGKNFEKAFMVVFQDDSDDINFWNCYKTSGLFIRCIKI